MHKAFGSIWNPKGVMCDLQTLIVWEPLVSLTTTQGLAMWGAVCASWVFGCGA